MIAVIILFAIIFSVGNFFLVLAAAYIALKAATKQLATIIDECEKMDKADLFVKQWTKHNK